jgi:(p)ppGpp synthase/HD superfamily hydrolase
MNQEYLLHTAIGIAKTAHSGQKDKAGNPYIEHPLRVMDKLETIEEKIVGILHDVVEDTDITLDNLIAMGFPQSIIKAIEALTKRPQEDYQSYLERIKSNSLALKVKIFDMQDNMDIKRIKNPTEKDYQRVAKYQQIYPELLQKFKKISHS